MKFFCKCRIFLIFIGLCIVLYLINPNIGHVDIVLLDYKVTSDVYVLLGVIVAFVFIKSLVKDVFTLIKKLFKKTDEKRLLKSVEDLAKFIVSDGKVVVDIDRIFDVCKISVLAKNGISVHSKTNVPEVDIIVLKNDIRQALATNDVDNAIEVTNDTIKNFPNFTNEIKDELINVSVIALDNGKTFDFDPTRSKYKLSQDFINRYNIKIGIARACNTLDSSTKIKILEKLHKKYENDVEVARSLLSALTKGNSKPNVSLILKLIEETFKLKPDRSLAFDFLEAYNKTDAFEKAEQLTASVTNDNAEKIWFLLIVATKLELYQKIVEFVEILVRDKVNREELYVFFVKNYAVLSSEEEVVNLLCK